MAVDAAAWQQLRGSKEKGVGGRCYSRERRTRVFQLTVESNGECWAEDAFWTRGGAAGPRSTVHSTVDQQRKPIEGPTKRPSTRSTDSCENWISARAAESPCTELSEKVGKRGSMPKLIAQRPAIGSWTWSRDCVYWCCLASPMGPADGHPPTILCTVYRRGALAKQKKMMVIEPLSATRARAAPVAAAWETLQKTFVLISACQPADSTCSHGDINWREIRLSFFLGTISMGLCRH